MNKSAVLLLSTVTLLLCPASEAQTPLNQAPSRAVGQNSLEAVQKSAAPNVVEGREFFGPWSIAIDTSTTPSPLYVSDQGNNRILGWANASSFRNGQPADLVLGQVDLVTTTPGGPGTARSAGLNSPNAIAVDKQGNLYVVDLGNNRILRYAKPFSQPSGLQIPDFIIGQSTFSSNTPNAGGIGASTLSFTAGTTAQTSGLAFDQAGNLWVSDAGNNRVLRFNAADLARGDNKPNADLVLGQTSFTGNTVPGGASPGLNKAVLANPSGLAFDPQGRLYVPDAYSRVVVFVPPFSNGMLASRIMGIPDITIVNNQAVQTIPSASTLLAPESVFFIGNNPAVVDRGNNRVNIYDPFEQWPPETPTPPPTGTTLIIGSPSAKFVIGQGDFTSTKVNRGLPEPNGTSLSIPTAGVTYNNEVFVVDTGNNRVLVFSADTARSVGTASAKRVLGQDIFSGVAPNLVEGKEMWLYNGFGSGGNVGPGNASDASGIVIDNTSNPPRLYVSDTFNNRVLGFKDARAVKPGDYADIVIGQPDLQRTGINWPAGRPDVNSRPTDQGLFHPSGLAVDSNGDLWVADSGNGRVLRFPKPFEQGASTGERANLVLGQNSLFAIAFRDPTPSTMSYPFGIAFTSAGDMLVSDPGLNRVLYFRKGEGFRSFQAADKVIGQPDFFTVQGASTSSPNRFSNPRGIAIDTDDRLYVADVGSNRVAIYDRIGVASNDPTPALFLTGLNGPQSVYVSPLTGEIWVTNTRSSTVVRYPRFNKLAGNPAVEYSVNASAPLAVTQDVFGNLFVAEATNRVSIYFNTAVAEHGATFNETRPLAPGLIASLFPPAGSTLVFTNGQTGQAAGAPLPFTLADTSVTVAGQPAPLYYVGPNQINFVVPYSAQTSGTGDVIVTHPSTGQIVAVYTAQFNIANPGTFMMSNPPTLIAAINDDNTVNGPGNPVAWNHVISVFATGGGPYKNPPKDGEAATGPVETVIKPDVLLGTAILDPKYVQYSGLAPQFPGLWQVNIQIPPNLVAPGPADLVLVINSMPSNQGPGGRRLVTQIYVKQ